MSRQPRISRGCSRSGVFGLQPSSMKLRGLLVAILLVLGCRQGSAEPTVQDGDIIFQTSQSAQSQAIQVATRSPYSHMGLILLRGGRPFVLEAISHVQLTPLATWAARGTGG